VPGGIVAGSQVVIVTAAQVGHREAIVLEGARGLDTAHGVVHAADCGVVKLPRLAIVHSDAVHVDVIVTAVVGTELEAHRAPQVAHVALVNIGVRAHHDDILRHLVVFSQLGFREDEGRIVLLELFLRLRGHHLCKA